MANENAVILFTRVPLPGTTKTRLRPVLSAEECCLLQTAFLHDVFEVLKKTQTVFDLFVFYTPEGELDVLEQMLPDAETFLPQTGADLGQRMHNAFSKVLGIGYERCLLIGSDLPLLTAQAVDEAFSLLDNTDVVLSPTEDGGYYLIGLKEPCEELFKVEEYGVSTVFEKTMSAAIKAGRTCAVGTATMDVDDPRDLRALRERLATSSLDVAVEARRVLEQISGGSLYE